MSQVCPKYRDTTVPKFHKITNINGLTDGTGLARCIGILRYGSSKFLDCHKKLPKHERSDCLWGVCFKCNSVIGPRPFWLVAPENLWWGSGNMLCSTFPIALLNYENEVMWAVCFRHKHSKFDRSYAIWKYRCERTDAHTNFSSKN